LAAGVALGLTQAGNAQKRDDLPRFEQRPDGTVVVDDREFESIQAYVNSDYFRENGLRCATAMGEPADGGVAGGTEDCTASNTNPSPQYDPSTQRWGIPVVVHVIRTSSGGGNVSEALVNSQIDILNEDFLALAGTNGANGTDVQVEFFLATQDPNGNPTNGITYSNNTTWFNDGGNYWNTLAWDPTRYLNIYTNSASGALGYASIPQLGGAGSLSDRVVILWSAFGRNAPIGPPYNQGRTATHEVGHYLGLFHTFQSGCGTAACYNTGDLICDTNAEAQPHFSNCSGSSCGSPDPWMNYMDYSDDLCMEEFTPEQSRRMRCTLENWRPLLPVMIQVGPGNDDCLDGSLVFAGTHPVTNIDASTDGGTETGCSDFESDVWYKFVAQCDGELTIDLCDADFDTMVAIYQDCPSGAFEALACNDDACGQQSQLVTPITAGIYNIRVGGFQGAQGTANMVLTCEEILACPGDCGVVDGTVDIQDLLALLAEWGGAGACDLAPSGGDGNVDINDLLELLAGWGPCS
jgi:hypothetical protein